MILTKTTENHIQELVAISKTAFDSDINVGAPEVDGPPEYDSVEWHIEMMNQGHLFTAIVEDTIVGAVLFGDENTPSFMYIGKIFISPRFFRKGYGIELMKQIEAMNPNITMWCLDTPIWNQRTNNFYKKKDTQRKAEMKKWFIFKKVHCKERIIL